LKNSCTNYISIGNRERRREWKSKRELQFHL
jgi:hypothetical protein